MKQFLLIFTFLMGVFLIGNAQEIQLVPSAGDSLRMDTVVVSELQDVEYDEDESNLPYIGPDLNDAAFIEALPAIIFASLLAIFGLPFFIIAMVLWFRYKNKQARYKLAAEALATGRSIPQDLIEQPKNADERVLHKGIKNICLGIGLGVFLWVLTETEGIAAIGFLIFCIGVGQVLIAYSSKPRKEDR